MRRILAVAETTLLARLEAINNASEKFDEARRSVEEYAAAVDAAAAQVEAASAGLDTKMKATAETSDKTSHAMGDDFSRMGKDGVVDLDKLGEELKRAEAEALRFRAELGKAAQEATHLAEEAKRAEGFIGRLRNVFSSVGSALGTLHSKFTALNNTLRGGLSKAVSAVSEGFRGAFTTSVLLAKGALEKLVQSKFYGHMKKVSSAIGTATKATFGFIGAMAKMTGQAAGWAGRIARISSAFLTLGLTAKGVPTWVHMVALGLAGLSGAASGVLALGIPAMFMGMAFGAFQYKQSMDKAIAAGQQLTATQQIMYPIVSTITNSFKSLGPVVQAAGKQFDAAMQSIGPALTSIAQNLGPMITSLGAGLSQFVVILANGLAPVMKAVQPVMQSFATGLGTIAHGLVGLLSNINFGAAAQGLDDLFNAIGKLLPLIGQILNAFIPLAHVVLGPLLDAFIRLVQTIAGALGPVLTNLAPVLGKIVGALSPIISALGRFLGAVLPLLVPLGELVATFVQGLVPVIDALVQPLSDLIAGLLPLVNVFFQLLGAITPLIPPVVAVAAAIVGGLSKAILQITPLLVQLIQLIGNQLIKNFQQILPVVMQLIPPLAQLAGAVLQMLVQVLNALMPILPQLIQACIQVLTALIPIIPALTQIVTAVTPLLVILAKLVTFLAGPVISIVTIITGMFATILTAGFKFAAQVVEDVAGRIGQYLGFMLQGAKDVIKFFEDLFHNRWGKLWQDAKNILRDGVNGLRSIIDGVIEIGKDIVKGIWHGIENMAGWLIDQVKNLGANILNGLKSFLGIGSPSKKFAQEVGANIPSGIAQGIMDHAHLVGTAAQQVANQAVKSAQTGMLGLNASMNLSASGAMNNGASTIQVVFQGNQLMTDRDMQVFVDKMGPTLVNVLQRGGMNIRK